MVVIYVEKKSVAKSIAAALQAGEFRKKKDLTNQKLGILGYWTFVWNNEETYIIYGSGHLATLYSAKDYDEKYKQWDIDIFPCLPRKFKTKPCEKTIDFYNLALSLFKRADLIISATDSDREGQVVFEYLYKTTGVDTPWKRAWLPSDLTPDKIRKAFSNLEDWKEHYPLTLAGMVRSFSDWLIGCNLTVVSTLKFGGNVLMNEGRVQTAVLNMVSQRTREIEAFIPEPFWTIYIEITDAPWGKQKVYLVEPERFKSQDEALVLLESLSEHQKAVVVDKAVKKRVIKKPFLFSTTELQIYINKKYGYNVTEIAADMEALYNNHYITYPRTSASVLSNAQEKETARNIKKLFSSNEFKSYFRAESSWAPFTHRHFDDYLISKTEDAHTAVVPTGVIPEFSKLSVSQQNIYDTIARSIICLVYDDVQIEDTTITFEVGGSRFQIFGSVVLNYEKSWYKVLKKETDNELPSVSVGDRLNYKPFVSEGKTKPNSYYTQSSLLKAMTYPDKYIDDEDVAAFMKSSERGLGTGATRPEIIGALIKNQLIQQKGKHLIPTSKGYWLIDHIPSELKMIKDPSTTGKWEQMLSEIAMSDLETAKKLSTQFLQRIYAATSSYYAAIANSKTDYYSDLEKPSNKNNIVLNCPKCGTALLGYDWGYMCPNKSEGCVFSLGKFRGKKLTDRQMTNLLTKGNSGIITFTSKEGKKYKGSLSLDSNGDIKFDF